MSKKGLNYLHQKYGVNPDDVSVVKDGRYLYCIYDSLTSQFNLPFIATNDLDAQLQCYKFASADKNSFLFRFQKTYYLYRLLKLNDKVVIRMGMIDSISNIIESYENIQVRLENAGQIKLPDIKPSVKNTLADDDTLDEKEKEFLNNGK